MSYLLFNRHKIYYHSVSDECEESIIFLNGFGGSSRSWDPFYQRFTDKYRIILLDFPGQGRSDNIFEEDLHALNTKILTSLIEELNLFKLHIVGLSYGGRIGLRYAIHKALSSLTLISTSPINSLHKRNCFVEWERRLKNNGKPGLFEMLVEYAHDEDYLIKNRDKIMSFCNDFCEANKTDELFLYLRDLVNFRGFKVSELKSISCPVLAVFGENDKIVDQEQIDFIRNIRNVSAHIIPSSGHVINIEKPGELSKLIKEHLHEASNI